MSTARLGYSPCPNDTYIFYAWTHGLIAADLPVESHLHDVEVLNQWALEGRLELTKASAAAFLYAADGYIALRSGAALGQGVGPLVVARRPLPGDFRGLRVASPGRLTTAHLLFQLCCGAQAELLPLRYDQIMPAVARGEVDAGVIIHESRFTYAQHGLQQVLDLGSWWESQTRLPLPLGLILARRDLATGTIQRAQQATRDSLLYARRHGKEVFPYLKTNAIELEESVIQSHLDLYVNDFSLDIGPSGEEAVRELFSRAIALGVGQPPRGDLFMASEGEKAWIS